MVGRSFVVGLAGLLAGCNLIIGADEGVLGAGGAGGNVPSSGGPGVGGSTTSGCGACNQCTPVDCEDDNPCTDDICLDGECTHPLAESPDLAALQTAGNCKSIICGGSPPNTVSVDDDLDSPADDGNDCTQDICVNGAPYPYEAAGAVCNTTGACDAFGNCSACIVPGDCGADTSCGTRTCAGAPPSCGWSFVAANTAVGSDGTANNCQGLVCTGSSEVPAAGADNVDLPLNVPNDCRSPSCTAGVPGQATINNADLPLNVANDCRSPSCNAGTPGQATINNADLPLDVANDCKDPACVSGNPSTTNQASGTACDDGGLELGGQCLTGTCRDCTTAVGCDVGHPCIMNACCTPLTMAVACSGIECGMVSDGCGGMITCPSTCATSLKGPECNGNTCGCADESDCSQSTHYGDECVNGVNICGCNGGADCNNSPRGKVCRVTDVCGCNVSGDCMGAMTCVANVCQ